MVFPLVYDTYVCEYYRCIIKAVTKWCFLQTATFLGFLVQDIKLVGLNLDNRNKSYKISEALGKDFSAKCRQKSAF